MSDPVGERGCASSFFLPVSQDDLLQAHSLATRIRENNRRLPEIVYREGSEDYDLRHHVFRWEVRDPTYSINPSVRTYMDVFENGFQARPQGDTRDNVYCNLLDHVNFGGRVLGTNERTPHIFISTSLSSTWCPPSQESDPRQFIRHGYRYEIYAPGGIHVSQTLEAGNRDYRYPEQDEVCFVGGIARQFIRSVQSFNIIGGPSGTIMARSTSDIILNSYFGPPTHILIQNPIIDYEDDNDQRSGLIMRYFPPQAAPERKKREVSTIDWYAIDVANCESYIDAAFRSSGDNEAYLFMKNEYVLVNYAPGTTNDKVLNGPLRISQGFPSLKNTAFAEYGIDSAFRCHNDNDNSWIFHKISNEAFIFSGNLCAHIDYAPGTTDDKIIKGPMTITDMFPFFKGTVFESGVDAAFEATASYEAYLFKGNQYALINYSSDNCKCIALRPINQGFGGLVDTIFESGIDAAFASHKEDEAYLFKGDSYALINFAPATTKDYIIGEVKKILPNWPSLRGILPHNNRGLDGSFHTVPDPNPGHDEL